MAGKWSMGRWLSGIMLFVALILTVPHLVAINSGAYKMAVATANARAEFNDALRSPKSRSVVLSNEPVWGTSKS